MTKIQKFKFENRVAEAYFEGLREDPPVKYNPDFIRYMVWELVNSIEYEIL